MAAPQRITYFGDDDVTPLLGIVDGSGNVIEPSFGTELTDVRPHLKYIEHGAETEVNFRDGRSQLIGSMLVELIDYPRVAGDQDTGHFTHLMATALGENALAGRRCLAQEFVGGEWVTLIDGPVGDINLKPGFTTYRHDIFDWRYRERRRRIFTKAPMACVFPRGVLNGYINLSRTQHGGDYFAIPPVQPAVGTFVRDPVLSHRGEIRCDGRWGPVKLPLLKSQLDMGKPIALFDSFGRFLRLVYGNVHIMWRPVGTSTWNEIDNMPYVADVRAEVLGTEITFPENIFVVRKPGFDPRDWTVNIQLITDGSFSLPTNNQRVEVILTNGGEPTEDFPFYFDGTFGELLKGLCDGDYSDEDPHVPYNEARMTELLTEMPKTFFRLSKPVDDMFSWTQDHIYKPTGYAPTLDADGKLNPIKYDLPDLDEELLELNDQNTVEAHWKHKRSEAVNKITFLYKREFFHPIGDIELQGALGMIPAKDPIDLLDEREVVIQRAHASVILLGEKVVKYEPETIRSFSAFTDGRAPADLQSELGSALAEKRWSELSDRYRYGAQVFEVISTRNEVEIAAAKLGTWVLLGQSWLPDMQSRERGLNRLGQIIRIRRLSPTSVSFLVDDAGFNHQPVGQPTLGSITVGEDGVVEIEVTAIPAGADAEINYAINPTAPAVKSGLWLFAGRIVAGTPLPAVVKTPPLPMGLTGWVRARGVAAGKRRSAWTNPVSFLVAPSPGLRSISVSTNSAGTPEVEWEPNNVTDGVRLYYQQHDSNDDPNPVHFVDADATLKRAIIPIQGIKGQLITVDGEGWSGWNGVSVEGTKGRKLRASALIGDILGVPSPIVVLGGESSAHGGGLQRNGRIWGKFTFDADTEYMLVYSIPSLSTPVRVPELSAIWLNWTIRRLEGRIPSRVNWTSYFPITTIENYFRKVVIVPVSSDGTRGPTIILEAQAKDVGVGPTAGPSNLVIVTRGTSNFLSWMLGDTTSPHLIWRDGFAIDEVPAGVNEYEDADLESQLSAGYDVCAMKNYQTSPFAGQAVQPPPSTSSRAPAFLTGYPKGVINAGVAAIEIQWSEHVDALFTELEVLQTARTWVSKKVLGTPPGPEFDASFVHGTKRKVRLVSSFTDAPTKEYSAAVDATWGPAAFLIPYWEQGYPQGTDIGGAVCVFRWHMPDARCTRLVIEVFDPSIAGGSWVELALSVTTDPVAINMGQYVSGDYPDGTSLDARIKCTMPGGTVFSDPAIPVNAQWGES